MPFGGSFWAVPKRCDLDELRAMLRVCSELAEGKRWFKWDNYHQELVARRMYRLGHCDRVLSTKSIRVIKDEAQFFGFAYLDRSRKLVITKAGSLFVSSGNFKEVFKNQLIKLQLTNPAEERFTKEIRVFPFRTILRLLIDLDFLSQEEAGMYVFTMKSQNELSQVEKKIIHFRSLSRHEQEKASDNFKSTPTGRKLLVLAPYVGYAWSFFEKSGLLHRDDGSDLRIVKKKLNEVKMILEKFKNIEPCDFESEEEWFEYFGNPKHETPPQKSVIRVLLHDRRPVKDAFIEITDAALGKSDFSDSKGEAVFFLYTEDKYTIRIFSPSDYGKPIEKAEIAHFQETLEFRIPIEITQQEETVSEILNKVKDLVSRGFDQELEKKLKILERRGVDLSGQEKLIRGGRFEQLIFKILVLLSEEGVFDHVAWNGKEGKYGIPLPAQKISEESGKKLPDIIAQSGKTIFVVETTLLRGRAQWEKPEAVSVPDHVEDVISRSKGYTTIGIFIAEKIDKSVRDNLINRAISKGYKIIPFELEDFIAMVEIQEQSPASFWLSHIRHLWSIYSGISQKS